MLLLLSLILKNTFITDFKLPAKYIYIGIFSIDLREKAGFVCISCKTPM